jgi:Fe-S cluster assembly ATP-binding protein
MTMLTITDLHASVADKPILKGLNLTINPGEVHAIMGPNGAGKSTTGYVLGGRPGYEVTGGSATFNGEDLFALEPHERAPRACFWASSIRWRSPAFPTCNSCARR